MKIFKGNNLASVYSDILREALYNPDYIVSPRYNKTHELFNVSLEITDPHCNFFTNTVRSPAIKYLAGEMIWYFSGSNLLNFISKYSKFWNAIANADGTCNSAYGYLLFSERNEHGFTEWGWALRSLCMDKDSRQAIIRFNKPRLSYSKNPDFVCTLNGHFLIRNNKLHFTIFMRSNDLRTGIQYDIPFFTILQIIMWKQLLFYYPDLQLGSYTHFISSVHLYEKDFIETEKALKEQYISQTLPEIEYLLPITEYGTPSDEYANLINGIIQPDVYDPFYRWIITTAELSRGSNHVIN